jgi:UDP-N-acetylmuramate: L-alanyl-gamma-D-glutamyl-meso-diaminopimelate ligase
MQVHFIAIGGSAMHNLAIALSRKGYKVTGSDDEIVEPSKSRLDLEGILPLEIGWNEANIHSDLGAVILGMHAREDNIELLKAKELSIPIYSYPEYLYEQSKNKIRIVIGGSHGKTTITSMLLHATKKIGINVDYMVGAQLDGYDCMVKLTDDAKFMVLEGDEYLSSPIDRRPKFHLYSPNVALISGIAWDHINVFPTFENYCEQFDTFCSLITPNGPLIYNEEDVNVHALGNKYASSLKTIPYKTPHFTPTHEGTLMEFNGIKFPLKIFGAHNLQNLVGAMYLAQSMGISDQDFLSAMNDFTGAGKRLQKVVESERFTMFKDFAHSPSKLKATTAAIKQQYPTRKVVACMELHTFSSLKKEFLSHYKDTMLAADDAIVYFNPDVVAHKKLASITCEDVIVGFGGNVIVFDNSTNFLTYIYDIDWNDTVLLLMSSGNFDGIDYKLLGDELIEKLG